MAFPSAAARDRFRSLVAGDVFPTLADAELDALLLEHALPDAAGRGPVSLLWVERYDLNGAAADGWELKAAKISDAVAITDNGTTVHGEQAVERALERAASYRKRRTGSATFPATTLVTVR